MKILLVGDTHGDMEWIRYCFELAAANKYDKIFQLGDFGYWSDGFLDKIAVEIKKTNIPFYWLDGNHEDFRLLKKWNYQKFDSFIEMRDGLFYSPRAHSWKWEGLTFMSLGGAYSIDRNWRVLGESWFTQEEITERDISNALLMDKVDVLLSHDVPDFANIDAEFIRRNRYYIKSHVSYLHRTYLDRVVSNIYPNWVFHGHYHIRYSKNVKIPLGGMKFTSTGLACSGDGDESLLVIDVKNGILKMNMDKVLSI